MAPSATTDAAAHSVFVRDLLKQCVPRFEGCMLWQGSYTHSGRPVLHHANTTQGVARAIYEDLHGHQPHRVLIEAVCGERRCVAPKHLRTVKKATANKAIIGVPLPAGKTVKTAGYKLLHRDGEPSVWEPREIANAVLAARAPRACEVCDKPLAIYVRFCGKMCSEKHARRLLARNRRRLRTQRMAAERAAP